MLNKRKLDSIKLYQIVNDIGIFHYVYIIHKQIRCGVLTITFLVEQNDQRRINMIWKMRTAEKYTPPQTHSIIPESF